MSKHVACRLSLAVAAVLSLGACGVLESKPERAFAHPPAADAAVAAGVEASPAKRSGAAVVSSGEAGQGLRPPDSRFQLNLNVFGFSYHPDRAGARDRHLDNEVNLGLGLDYQFANDAVGVASLQAGFFKDSGRNWTKLAGVGYQFKFGERWRLGADLLAIQSPTYNNGRGFVAPIPRVTYDFGAVKANLVYVPRYGDHNRFAAFGLYFSTPLGAW